jgi:hypothetical protein
VISAPGSSNCDHNAQHVQSSSSCTVQCTAATFPKQRLQPRHLLLQVDDVHIAMPGIRRVICICRRDCRQRRALLQAVAICAVRLTVAAPALRPTDAV